MAYGLKFICEFSRLDVNYPEYKLHILQKDYFGGATRLIGGTSPVRHRYDTDEPNPPIKGSSIEISLINTGLFPLDSVYSNDADEFKVQFFWTSTSGVITLFEGFIVQEDSSELMVDYTHEVTLSATDNLGLLKDVSFGDALNPRNPVSHAVTINSNEFAINMPLTLDVGDQFEIRDSFGSNYGTYTVASVVDTNSYTTTTQMPAFSGSFIIVLFEGLSEFALISLASLIKVCLKATGLDLYVNVFSNINETTQSASQCFIEQTLINPQTFLSGDTYDDCYTVLSKVFSRFKLTLFQAKGKWQIVRWDELRYYDHVVPGFAYDPEFRFLNQVYLNESAWPKFPIGINEVTKAENGLLRMVKRPYGFVKETFNYRQPAQLLRNFDLQELGSILNTYTTGSGADLKTVREYEFVWWQDAGPPGSSSPTVTSTYFIRVISDSLGNELERYAVVKDDNIISQPIEVNAGDYFRFSFSFKTSDSQPGNLNINFEVKLISDSETRFVRNPGDPVIEPGWGAGPGWTMNIPAGDNSNEWHSVEIESQTIPFDGLLYCYLQVADLSGTDNGTYYRDLRFEYIPLINQSTQIVGHTHKSTQTINAKNNESEEIFIDSSPRNSIAGTLFLSGATGLLQTRCGFWKRASFTEEKRLGEIITKETLFLRRKPRELLEGTFYGLRSFTGDHLSLLSVIRYTFFPVLNFIIGRLEIDYKNNNASCTLYEMYKDNEQDSDLAYYYSIDFLYEAK